MDAASIAHAPMPATMARTPQHMLALEQANRVRLARAALKRSIGRGEVEIALVVSETPWEAESMTLSELLTSQRRWGHTRCRKFLQSIPMSEHKTIGSMTERQRAAVARQLGTIPASEAAPRRHAALAGGLVAV